MMEMPRHVFTSNVFTYTIPPFSLPAGNPLGFQAGHIIIDVLLRYASFMGANYALIPALSSIESGCHDVQSVGDRRSPHLRSHRWFNWLLVIETSPDYG